MGKTTEVYVLGGDARGFSAAVQTARRGLGQLVAGAQTAIGTFGGMRAIVPAVTAIGTAVALIGGRAVSAASDFDAAMRSVAAKTGATGAELVRLTEQAREMGRTTVHSATEAARGQAFLAQAGFKTRQVMEALPAVLALATAGELDLSRAADIASNVLKGFRLETSQTARVADVLALAAASTNTNIDQLGAALAKAAPAAAAAGWSLEETVAVIGRLSDAGIQAEEAGTSLKTIMARLATATPTLRDKLKELGIELYNADGSLRSITDIMGALSPHANDLGLQFELLGTRGGNAGLILSSVGREDIAGLTEELMNAEGEAVRMADTMSGGLWGAVKTLTSIVESANISFGERFGPSIQKVARFLQGLPAPMQEVIVIAGSLGVALGLTSIAFGTAWVAALGPIAYVVAGVGAVAAAVYALKEAYGTVRPSITDVRDELDEKKEALAKVTERIDRYTAAEKEVPPALIRHREEVERLIAALEEQEAALQTQTRQQLMAELRELQTRYLSLNKRIEESVETFGFANAAQEESRDTLAQQIAAVNGQIVAMDAATVATDEVTAATDEATTAVAASTLTLQDVEAASKAAAVAAKAHADSIKELAQQVANEKEIRDRALQAAAARQQAAAEALRQTAAEEKAVREGITAAITEQVKASQGSIDAMNAEQTALLALIATTPDWHAALTTAQERLSSLNQMGLEPSVEALIQLREELLRAGVPLRELPEIVRKAAEAGADFGEMFLADMEQILSPDNITGIFTRAFTGGGGVMGALKGIGTQLAGALSNAFLSPLTKSISEGLTSLVGGLVGGSGGGGGGLLGGAMSAAGSQAAGAFMGGSSAAAGGAAGGGLAGGISGGASTLMGTFMSVASAIPVWGWAAAGGVAAFMFFKGFGGPSKAELKGRETADAFHKSLAARANENQTQEALLAGWDDPEFAKTWIVIRDGFKDAGKSVQEAHAFWDRWRAAIKEGPEAVRAVQQEFEALTGIVEATQQVTRSLVSDYQTIVAAANEASNQAIAAAIAQGQSQEQAAAAGTAAWTAAYEEQKRLRIKQLAEEAAFSAALEAILEGNADNAVAAATAAYDAMEAAGTAAFEAIEQASEDSGQAIRDDSEKTADTIVSNNEEVVDSNEDIVDSNEDIVASYDRLYDKVVSAWRGIAKEADSAAQKAYDAAVKTGASHEEAAKIGTQAWHDAYAKHATMRIEEMAREAAFAAALTAIREGNADQAVALAAAAYDQMHHDATVAFDATMQAVTASGVHTMSVTTQVAETSTSTTTAVVNHGIQEITRMSLHARGQLRAVEIEAERARRQAARESAEYEALQEAKRERKAQKAAGRRFAYTVDNKPAPGFIAAQMREGLTEEEAKEASRLRKIGGELFEEGGSLQIPKWIYSDPRYRELYDIFYSPGGRRLGGTVGKGLSGTAASLAAAFRILAEDHGQSQRAGWQLFLNLDRGISEGAFAMRGLAALEQFKTWANSDRPVKNAGALAAGGSFLASEPTLFIAGERGDERVDVTPVGAAAAAGGPRTGDVWYLQVDGKTWGELTARYAPHGIAKLGRRLP